ncbi:MAG: hypothetical protein ACFFAN_18850 [Promethearchaeota archaeon]
MYFFEAQEIAEVLFEKKREIDDISDACAIYDQVRWMASIIDESDKELFLRTADLYEQYAVQFKRVKRKLSAEDAKSIRPYIKVLESATWHYQLGDSFIKSAEKYVEINKSN